MSKLNVIDHEGLLVVDSRLIALELGIQHKNFLVTLDKYAAKMAESHVVKTLAFQTRELKTVQGNIITERWAWLTEPQANFLMTLSRNTEQVVNCKLKLVEAFETKAGGTRQEAEGKNLVGDSDPHQISATESEISVGDSNPCSVRSQQRAESSIPSASCPLPSAFLVETAKLALSEVVNLRVAELEEKLAVQGEAIALLQSQVQNLLPISADFIPPGWDANVWEKLPPQDKQHFRFIYQKYGFRPDGDPETTSSISADARRKQNAKCS